MKKKISIAEIQSGALIGTPVAISVPITLGEDECEFDTHVKPFSYATVVARWSAVGQNKEALAGTIASCVCDEKGKLLFTEDEVRANFSEELIEALWAKIIEVNNIGGKLKKTNSEKMNSSQNSPLMESVGTPLKKSKRTSRSKKSNTGVNTPTDAEASTQVEESSKPSDD
ncbi:phage tail assembly chaperone family protein, TAC [Acinetobacter sp. KS-LM10]|uniref:phage tail assembly chaperone family protein, TAC n=1 Tax=Acinetobacter sp. KS-LM10 TaxID=3120518 RepID=UPI0030CBC92A